GDRRVGGRRRGVGCRGTTTDTAGVRLAVDRCPRRGECLGHAQSAIEPTGTGLAVTGLFRWPVSARSALGQGVEVEAVTCLTIDVDGQDVPWTKGVLVIRLAALRRAPD